MKSIKYNLVEASMPTLADKGKYLAQVQLRGSLGFDEMADRILAQGSCVTKPDILAVFENLATALETAMLEGYRVNFGGVFDMFPSVRGTFDDITAPFDASVHSTDVRARCGTRIRSTVMANAAAERVYLPKPAPTLLAYRDLTRGTTDTWATPAGVGTLNGLLLRFDPDAADEGIFFVPVAGGEEHRAALVQRNKPGELVFVVPHTLTLGATYHLEVRARLRGGEDLRTGRLPATLDVDGNQP